MAQAPCISIPKKTSEGDVDWVGAIRQLISTSYGENPDNYASECAQLQRCRQDAVRGAGSDTTGRHPVRLLRHRSALTDHVGRARPIAEVLWPT